MNASVNSRWTGPVLGVSDARSPRLRQLAIRMTPETLARVNGLMAQLDLCAAATLRVVISAGLDQIEAEQRRKGKGDGK